MKIARWSLGLLLAATMGMPAGITRAMPQSQDDSVAGAARRSQAEKASQPASQKVWTNDNIPQTPGAISVVGIVQAAPAENGASGIATPPGPAATAVKATDTVAKRSAIQADLDAAKEQLKSATSDLDILTRKRVLDAQSYYGKPDYVADTAGAAQLQQEQADVDTKKQETDALQKKVDDLQSQLSALGPEQPATGDSGNTPSSTSSDTPAGNSSNTTPNSPAGASTNSSGGIPVSPPNGHSTPPSK